MSDFYRSFKKGVKATSDLAKGVIDKTASKIRSNSFSIITKIMKTDMDYVRMQQRMANAVWGGGIGDGDFKKAKAYVISSKLLKTMEKKVSGSDRKLLNPLINFHNKIESNSIAIKKACVGNADMTDIFNSLIGIWVWLVGMVAASGLRIDSNKKICWSANKKTMHFLWEKNNLDKSAKFSKFVEARVREFDSKIVKSNAIDKLLNGTAANESPILLTIAAVAIGTPVILYCLYEMIQFVYFTFRHLRMELSEFIELQSEYLQAESGTAESKSAANSLSNISNKVREIAFTIGEDYEALEKKVTKQSEDMRKQIEKETKVAESMERENTDVSASKIETSSNDLLF